MIRQERLRTWMPGVLALGSNLGDREQTLRDAVAAIDALDGVRVTAASGIVETPALKPDGVDVDAPSYLNAVIEVRLALAPEVLLDALNKIERENGRVRDVRWGDRTLDIDIIDIAGHQHDTERLTLPHPRAWERAFVLAPWLQIAPDAEIVGRGRIADLLAATGDVAAPFEAEPLR